MPAPGDDHVDGEAGFETPSACQLPDPAAALEDGLEHLDACAARIPRHTLQSIANGVDRDGSHQQPIDGGDTRGGMAFLRPHGPQGEIRPGCKGGKAHAQPRSAWRLRALKGDRERDIAGLGHVLHEGLQVRLVAAGAHESVALLRQGLLEEC